MGFGRDDERPDLVGYVLSIDELQMCRGKAPVELSHRDVIRQLWLYAADIEKGSLAASSAHVRLNEIANENGNAIRIECEHLGGTKFRFKAVGPWNRALGLAMLAKERGFRMPVPAEDLWDTPSLRAKMEADAAHMTEDDRAVADQLWSRIGFDEVPVNGEPVKETP